MSWRKRIAWALVVLGAVLLLVWSVRLVSIGLSLQKNLSKVQALADAPESVDPTETCGLIRDLRGDVVALRQEAGGLVQLAPLLGWLPGYGGDLQAAPLLLETADGLTEAGTLVCDALNPLLAAGERGSLTPRQVLDVLTREQAALERALAATEQAQTAWDQVDVTQLSPWLAGKVSRLDQGLPLLRTGLQMATVAPELLGANGPRTYLILAQNDEELRPTGGFISGAGVITVEDGRIAEVNFMDANLVDDFLNKSYPAPPAPLFDTMGSEIWLFRDANWSPDFPTSARQAAYFYEYGQGVPVDGVIAIDQRAVELLMTGIGEVRVSGVDEPITAANVRQFVREAWNPGESGTDVEWVYSRKEFIGQLAAAIVERIESDPGSVDWVQVAKGAYDALGGRHLLLCVDDQTASNVLAQVNWDGAIREVEGDYLMVVNANLGFNKANPLVEDQIDYRVVLHADGTASAALSLTYIHRGEQSDAPCQQEMHYTADITYSAMMQRCYYDYLRVYVPASSVLRTATPHPTPAEYLVRRMPADGRAVTLGDEAGKTVFAQFFVVGRGQTLTTHLEYGLPQVARSNDGRYQYALLIQKQAGTDNAPISLTITLPPGAKLLTATPHPQTADGNVLTFSLQPDADVLIEVTYE